MPIETTVAHLPERTCLACGRKTAKSELLRLCRDQAGNVIIDVQQRLPGRGAYVCPQLACAELLVRKKALHHGFRANIPAAAYAHVIAFMKQHDS
jgi:predicted RNA-binding protein YlxR (DUF448 family)